MGKVKTHEEFISELENVKHLIGDIKIKERYKGDNIKILAEDKYGEILITPSNLRQGRKPTVLSAINQKVYYINMIKDMHPNIFDGLLILSEYKNATDEIIVENEFGKMKTSFSKLKKGNIPNISSAINKHEYFANMLKKYNPRALKLKFITKYELTRSDIIVEDEYGQLKITPEELLNGSIPTIISAVNKESYFSNMINKKNKNILKNFKIIEYRNDNKVLMEGEHGQVLAHKVLLLKGIEPTIRSAVNPESYVWSMMKYKNKYVYENFTISRKFKKSDSHLYIADRYGELKVLTSNLLGGQIPIISSAVNPTDYWINMAKEVHGDLYNYDKVTYKKSSDKVCITCMIHGDFWQKPSKHKDAKQGCPICKNSQGELKISRFLEDNFIENIQQYKFNDCTNVFELPFDFYLYNLNTCIEYDGEQHFSPVNFNGISDSNALLNFNSTKHNDKIKTEYCKDNNIKLIRIPYWDFEKIEEILSKELGLSVYE